MAKKLVMLVAIFILLLAWLAFGSGPNAGQSETRQFTRYPEMRQYLGELYEQKKFKEAAALLEAHIDKFPENYRANALNLALMDVKLGENEKAVGSLTRALDRGAWFGKYSFYGPDWTPLRDFPSFKAFLERNEGFLREARKNVRPALEVLRPEGFVEGKKYPLFIALHGGGENAAGFQKVWTSGKLRTEFIVAYPQSVQLVAENGFNWTEDVALGKQEVKAYYDQVVREHAVDTGQVFIGGFSSGGAITLEAVAADLFPVAGFIVLCPPQADGMTAEAARAAARRGVRGAFITTEFDPRLKDQRAMVELMKNEGLALELFIFPNTGHWIPTDLDKRVDVGLDYIRQGRSGT
jgi:predicted esterase